ncbi:BrxA/BrxB family bacilliredoxin [Hazenella sp. IB182357]|uniref:BrxA/BrxB family bacilliredoxin n=1 Tax=Polycladospora coralii TaxID=2771432 RepID=A0A926NAS9_9BACL|nr:BrxA/BrxB family bacilliredoxin [Polycladospora coralii]MBD1373446.1 BrxA/BrxB family bacilliredoxin [Polycladospora coralii]MBS7531223.1 BrxA/BrxB family bacilliredoxin [Polycladospora coralii]
MSQNFYFQQMQMMVQPMRDELTQLGIKELRTTEEVDAALKGEGAKGTALIVVNSVCGCAAGLARPGVAHSLQNDQTPDHLYTVFAGQDKEATARAREYFEGQPPSSPSFVLMKDGKLVHMVHRHEIENVALEDIAKNLTDAYDKYCN